ncbi:argininosuccinate lyase [Marinicella meishanensis]|uniref:argininosuccinate lyase n=1 Tax=Marinicella meishanensis TaxID=2873263 RepID=UPI001CBBB6FF|nr:argininosuccinate lyase [Marinicella sp. NBU2979]
MNPKTLQTSNQSSQTTQTLDAVLWSAQENTLPPEVMAYLAGADVELDQALFLYDIQGTLAHLKGLAAIELISAADLSQFEAALAQLQQAFIKQEFVLDSRFEDGHSAIEFCLTEQLGELGKKAHTGRSRNDQVLTCLRLFMKDQMGGLKGEVVAVIDTLLNLAKDHTDTLMPGYTHLQRAMPTTVAVWLLGFAEGLLDDLQQLNALGELLDASPLGTAAGFGVPLPLARELTAAAMGLSRVQVNPVAAQNSRGKYELMVLHQLSYLMSDVRRFSWDLSLFMTQEFNFIGLKNTHTTGSSIMPNKNNPDVVEIMRASQAVVDGAAAQVHALLSLPSGYQRDLQLSKEPLIKGLKATRDTFVLLPGLLEALVFNTDIMQAAITPAMMATDQALAQVQQGQSFRDAYLASKDGQTPITPEQSIQARVSLGGAANLGLEILEERLEGLTQ